MSPERSSRMTTAHHQAGEPRLVADVRRRLDLLSRAERLRWLTFFPIGAITAGFETLGGVVVFGLVALLSNPDTAMRQSLVAGLARLLSGVGLGATVLTLALVAVALYAVKNFMLLASLYYRAHVIGDIAAELASRVVRAYLTAPYVFHLRRSSAEVAQNVLGGLPAVLRLLDSVVTFATELFVVIGLLILLFRLAPIETIVALALIGGVLGLFLGLTRGHHHRLGARHYELSAKVLKRMQQAMGGIKEVKVFGREQYFYDALARAEEARARVAMSYIALESIPRLVAEMSFVLGLVGLILTLQLRTSDFGTALPFIGLYAYAGFRLIPAGHRLNLHLGLIRYDLAVSTSLARDAM
jgi:ATP-binding cassette subfamily C protein